MQGYFNFWSIILLVSISQGLFLIALLNLRQSENRIAKNLLVCLVAAILVVNLDYFLISSSLYRQLPHLLGISFGLMFVFGPLFYLYLRSVADMDFKWKAIYWLNFLPWVASFFVNGSFYFLSADIKILIVDNYLLGKTSLNGFQFYLMNSIQILHLCIYLIISYRILKSKSNDTRLAVSINSRVNWLKELFLPNLIFVLSFACWFVFICVNKVLFPPIDYTNTIICSAMVFMIGFKLVLNPQVLTPGFTKKYKGSSLSIPELERHLSKLRQLMEQEKLYTEPELKLHEVADHVGVPPHKLSQIINQEFGKSFQDFLNEYRVEEFKRIISMEKPDNSSMLAIAMKVGFNSKSAFNAAFKKFTRESPSEFKNRRLDGI